MPLTSTVRSYVLNVTLFLLKLLYTMYTSLVSVVHVETEHTFQSITIQFMFADLYLSFV